MMRLRTKSPMVYSSTALVFLLIFPDLVSGTLLSIRDADDAKYCNDRVQNIGYNITTHHVPCQIPGQTDFYGLGVRMGIYFAWFSSWIANNFVSSEMAGSLDTNAIFLLALTTTVVVMSWRCQILLIDSLILLQLALGCVFGVMSLWGYRTRYYKQKRSKDGFAHFGSWGTHCRLVLCTAISFYALWFWTWSVSHPDPTCFQRKECGGLRIWLFASVRMQGGARWVHATVAAGCCVYYGVACIVATITWVRYMILRASGDKSEWIPQNLHDSENRRVTIPYVFLLWFTLFWMLYSMLSVEFTLNFNHVVGVLAGQSNDASAGQLLPLLIGLLSFVRILWILYKERISEGGASLGSSAPREANAFATERVSVRQLSYGLLTAWLPWLNCFESWRQYGDVRPQTKSFQLLEREDYDTMKQSSVSGN